RYPLLTAHSRAQLDSPSLHDALPIWRLANPTKRSTAEKGSGPGGNRAAGARRVRVEAPVGDVVFQSLLLTATAELRRWFRASLTDRKSTRLNSSHVKSSYAVFCLKKK